MSDTSDHSGKRVIAQVDRGSMRRILGVKELFAVGYGDLGSSIYYALGITAMFALGATPIALILAGLVFTCTALTYAEMSSVIKESGGSASYTRLAFNDMISFVAGWGLLLDYIVTIAISSYSVGPYLSYFIPILEHTEWKLLFALFVMLALYGLNIRGVHHSTRLSLILTTLTILTQFIIIGIGFATVVHFGEFFRHLTIGGPSKLYSPSWGEFWKGVAMAMVAYTGIESMAQLSGEAKSPHKTVPRAIMIALAVLLVMYIGISTVALSAVSPEKLSTTYLENPIAGIVEALPFGHGFLAPWVGLLAAIVLFVAANAGLLGSSRLAFHMGEHFQLPRFFYKLHKKYQTPYVSLAIFGGFACLLVLASRGHIGFLADLYNFGAMIAFFSANISLILHRIRHPDMKRPFRVKGNLRFGKAQIPITAILGALTSISVWVLVVVTKPDGRYLGIAWLVVGTAIYFYFRYTQKIKPTENVEIEKIKIAELGEFTVKNILVPTRGGLHTETMQYATKMAKCFGAKLTAVYITEVPFAFPLTSDAYSDQKQSQIALKRAQAVALEQNIPIELKVFKARSVVEAVMELVHVGQYDLVIIGASSHQHLASVSSSLGKVTEEILKRSPVRVWVCRT